MQIREIPNRSDHLPERAPGTQRLGQRGLVGSEQLLIYNIALATLERQTGTILETHGLVFAEERYRAAGPLPCHNRMYPSAQPPFGHPRLYPGTGSPSENSFDLQNPVHQKAKPTEPELPAPRPVKPAERDAKPPEGELELPGPRPVKPES